MISQLVTMAALLGTPPGEIPAEPVRPSVQLVQAAVSPDQAAAMARAQTGGRVLGVDWGDNGGQPVYQVRVLMPDGSIRTVAISASGGR